jgi:zinc transport system substrate-binding protein
MRTIIVLILGAAFVGGCAGNDAGGSGLEVAAASYPLAFAAEEIAGATADVHNLTPPGAEPHDVELSVRDVERVRSADVVLLLGGGFQPALEDAAEGAQGEVVDLLEGLALVPGEDDAVDPHVWLDPVRYAEVVRQTGAALGRMEAADALARRLDSLHGEIERGLADCERREIVTSHAAFAYLADRYELRQIALTGLSPEAEPSAAELESLVEEVRAHDATTVFAEPLVSPRLAETVAREAGVEVATLNPLEGLTEDELAAGADYFSVMRENLEALRKALGCR